MCKEERSLQSVHPIMHVVGRCGYKGRQKPQSPGVLHSMGKDLFYPREKLTRIFFSCIEYICNNTKHRGLGI